MDKAGIGAPALMLQKLNRRQFIRARNRNRLYDGRVRKLMFGDLPCHGFIELLNASCVKYKVSWKHSFRKILQFFHPIIRWQWNVLIRIESDVWRSIEFDPRPVKHGLCVLGHRYSLF